MTTRNDAINLDVAGEYENAVKEYERVISQGNATIEIITNLAFIYWESVTQFTFTNGIGIPDSLKSTGVENYKKILHLGLFDFPNSPELHFWDRYFLHRGLFEDFSDEDCNNILNKYGREESLVPYFFLYLFDKEKYKRQREELLRICNESPTAKNNWIKSLIA